MLEFIIAFTVAAGAPPADLHVGCSHAKAATVESAGMLPDLLLGVVETDVLHYDLDLELDPPNGWLGGSNTMTVRSVSGVSTFRFRLSEVFDITAVEMNGAAVAWARLDHETVDVTLDRTYTADEVFALTVAYDGVPGPGMSSIVFRNRDGADEVWTLSEPWFAYTWWPSKDDATDKTTADLAFTVPAPMIVASNGLRVGIDALSGNRLRYRWQTLYPTADYLYCFGATNYNTFSAQWDFGAGLMPLEFFIYPEEDDPDNRAAWLETVDMLDVFTDRFGLYPFADEKYGMCQIGFGGGMEHQTITSQGGFWEHITAHELGHHWWGDMITCATWSDIWLNEGFATYSEALWFGAKPGSAGMADYHAWMNSRKPYRFDESVYIPNPTSVARIFSSNYSYTKPAWALHMLRHVVGDETFFDTLATYRTLYEYSSVTTADFQAVAEMVYGQDLDWFFEEWIYEAGAPEYRYAWRPLTINGDHYVELYIGQVQDSAFPTYEMPIDIAVTDFVQITTHVVTNDAGAEHFLLPVARPAIDLDFDPETWILWETRGGVSFVEGPPKVVSVTPAPGTTVESTLDLEIEVTFHKNVVTAPGQYTLVGANVGGVAVDLDYDAGAYKATLTPHVLLAPDIYTLTISDGVFDATSGLALDGEVTDPANVASLPSGEGLPGGEAIVVFTVEPEPLAGDVDGNGLVGFSDLLLVISFWGPCPGCAADLNGDGVVGFTDLTIVLSTWTR